MLSSSIGEISNVSPFSAVLVLVSAFSFIVYLIMKDRGLPPGPYGLPYFGYWLFLKEKSACQQLEDMHKKHGDIFSFRFLGRLYISLGSVKAIREAHVTKSEYFAGRCSDFNALTYTLGDGVGFMNGEPWKVLRKFFVHFFRECGMASIKDNTAGPIYENLNAVVEELRAKKDEPVNVTDLFMQKCCNIMRRILFNDDGISEEEVRELKNAYGVITNFATGYRLLLHGNFARYVVFPLAYEFRDLKMNVKIMEDILHNIVKQHESTFDENNIRDIIDSYIKERNERTHKGDSTAKYFTNKALVSSLIQFVGDGVISVAGFIGSFLYALIEYPEEQEKIYKELLDVVGSDRQPTLEDRNRLPYTNAFLSEVMRHSDFFTLFPSLECSKETTLRGYRIPKGAITFLNIWRAQHNPEVYEEPYAFNPSRYVPAPGKEKPDLPVMFGIGKRACIGEAFTMIQTFLFVTTIVKNFRITLRDGYVGNAASFLVHENLEICAHPRSDQ